MDKQNVFFNHQIFTWNDFPSKKKIDEYKYLFIIINFILPKVVEVEFSPMYNPNKILNEKIYLTPNKTLTIIEGGFFKSIDALALQIPKKHLVTKPSKYRLSIIQKCGEAIYTELSKEPVIALGDYVITNSYSLYKVKNLIHSALPKYSENFTNASLSSLHLSIRNIIDCCIENNFENLILGKDIFNPAENFPLNESVEVVIRTLRKCLDKVGNYFKNIIIAIDDDTILNKIDFYMRVFFPRNEEEKNIYKKYIKNIPETEYGDLVMTNRNITVSKHIKENEKYIKSISYNDMDNFTFEDNDNKNDSQRIKEIFNEEVDFAKKFYYDNIKHYNEDIESKFENLNFISYKGTDRAKRQIYFVYLKMLDFQKMEEYKLEKDMLLYCYNCILYISLYIV